MVINCLENKKKQSEKVMGTIKGIPYGMSNFEDVITQNRYYVDKTMYIPMLEDQANYLIFIRPRRFGKTMGMGMLAHFLIYGPITGGYSMVLKLSTMKHCAVHG